MYRVYCLKDRTGKVVYIGRTKNSLSKRLADHKAKFEERKELVIELISELPTIEAAMVLESLLIKQYDLCDDGLNKSSGYEDRKTETYYKKDKDQTNGFYGHNHSEEERKKISERFIGNQFAVGNSSRLGRKNGEVWKKAQFESHAKAVMCIETGKIFDSIKSAAKHYNLQSSKISLVCNGKRKTTGGLTFQFV